MTDYSLKTLMMESNPTVVFRGIAGSHAYGTNNAQSDVDIRGIFVVPSGEYVRLTPPPKQVSDERNDITYYSLLRFASCCCRQIRRHWRCSISRRMWTKRRLMS